MVVVVKKVEEMPEDWGAMRGPPKAVGLYDPAYEKDACGIGFIADLKRRATRETVVVSARCSSCVTRVRWFGVAGQLLRCSVLHTVGSPCWSVWLGRSAQPCEGDGRRVGEDGWLLGLGLACTAGRDGLCSGCG